MHSHATQARDDTFDSVHGRLRSTYQRYSICRPIYQVKCDPKCDIQFLDLDGVFMVIIAVCFGSALYTARLFCLRESNFLLSLMPRKKVLAMSTGMKMITLQEKIDGKCQDPRLCYSLLLPLPLKRGSIPKAPPRRRRRQFVGAAAVFC